jgi:hypothetical protein
MAAVMSSKQQTPWVALSMFAVVGVLAICAFGYLSVRPSQYSNIPNGYSLVAHYDDFQFSCSSENVSDFRTGINDEDELALGNVYARSANGDAVAIKSISEEWMLKSGIIQTWEVIDGKQRRTYTNVRSMVQFKSGHLSLFHLVLDDLPIQIGPTKDGPFVSLPMTRARMIEVFGKPKRWSWSRRRGV